jgi:serine/threonine protein kinase
MVFGKDRPKVKLMDFGVIRDFNRPTVTESHEFLGTVRYAAPEWILGSVGQSTASQVLLDLYSLGAVLADLINGYPLFPKVNSRFQLAALKSESEPQVLRDDIPISFIVTAQKLIAIKPQDRHPATAMQLKEILGELEVGDRSTLAEENLERSLVSFNNLRKQYRTRQASLERVSKEMELVSNEVLSICRDFRDFLKTRMELEEWREADSQRKESFGRAMSGRTGRLSFGLTANESEAIFYPMTISISWNVDEQRRVTIRIAGFYSWIYYSRRSFTDALAEEVRSSWNRLLGQFDALDSIYDDKFITQAVRDRLKTGVIKLVNVFLRINKVEILARADGLKLDSLRLGKIRMNGEIMELIGHGSDAKKDSRCLIRDCTADRKEGKFLCSVHDDKLTSN